jgi:IclR family transcriptional regulator, acetate operon repressor
LRSPAGTQAVDRAADLLVRVIDSPEPVTFSTLAERTGLPKSTVSRLMSALERHGLVDRDAGRSYRPGEVFAGYARSRSLERDITEVARPYLVRLGEETGETINLGIATAGMVKQVAQVDSRYLIGVTNWLNLPVPLHCSALGKVLLAYGAAELPSGQLERRTEKTVTDRDALVRELVSVRRLGYATIDGELEPGLVAIAAPVHSGDRVVAAVSVSGPSTRFTRTAVRDAVKRCIAQSEALSRALDRHSDEASPRKEGAA